MDSFVFFACIRGTFRDSPLLMASLFQRRKAGLPFILATVFLDMLGFGIVIPVLPALVSTMTADKPAQAYWYGALLASYGVAQFFSAPLLGAISDRFGVQEQLDAHGHER